MARAHTLVLSGVRWVVWITHPGPGRAVVGVLYLGCLIKPRHSQTGVRGNPRKEILHPRQTWLNLGENHSLSIHQNIGILLKQAWNVQHYTFKAMSYAHL